MTDYCRKNPDDPFCNKQIRNFYYNETQDNTRGRRVDPTDQRSNPTRRKGTFAKNTNVRVGSFSPADETEPPANLFVEQTTIQEKRKRKVVGLKGNATNPIKASHTDITPEERMKAKMLEAAKIAELEAKTTNIDYILDADTNQARLDYGLGKAQEYLDAEGINYTVEPNLSTKEGLILINNETGVPKAVFRGTNFKNVSDLKTDLAIVHGQENLTRQFKSAKELVLATNEQYLPVDELLGFSLGGAKAITIGNELGIKTTTFNPAISPSHLKNVPLNSGDQHTLIRVTEDPVSALSGFKPSAFKIKSILPLNEPKWLNPESGASVHDLTNFSKTGARRSGFIPEKRDAFVKSTKVHNELVGLHEAKMAVEQGKTLTEFLREFSPNEVTREGTLNVRVQGNSKLTGFWKKAGGEILPAEQKAIVKNTIRAIQNNPNSDPDPFVLKDQEVTEFLERPENVRADRVQSAVEEVATRGNEFHEASELTTETRNSLKAQLSPANLGVGLVGGYAGAKVANLIDPNQKLGDVGHEALSGGLGGGFTAGAIATLGGEALTATALAPAVLSSAAGAIAGYETNKAVAGALQKAGANRDTVESVSDITAGAVGGAATGITAIGASALLGAEIGELGGAPGVLLGAGVGAVFGLGAYAVDAIKYNSSKEQKKRAEQSRLLGIANEAGFNSVSAFQEEYKTDDTYNGKEITPEENFYHQRRVEMFGYDTIRSKPMNSQELVQAQTDYDERIAMELGQRRFEMTNARAGQMAKRRGQSMVTMGGAVPKYYQEGDPVGNPYRSEQAIQRAQTETIRESQMQVNRDGSVTPGAVSKVTQEVQN